MCRGLGSIGEGGVFVFGDVVEWDGDGDLDLEVLERLWFVGRVASLMSTS